MHDLLLNLIGDSQFSFDESRPYFRCWFEQVFARWGKQMLSIPVREVSAIRCTWRRPRWFCSVSLIVRSSSSESLPKPMREDGCKWARLAHRSSTGFFFMYSSDQIRWAALMIRLLFGWAPDVGLSRRWYQVDRELGSSLEAEMIDDASTCGRDVYFCCLVPVSSIRTIKQ